MKNAPPNEDALKEKQIPELLNLGFLELDMLAGNRVIFGFGHFVGHGPAVLGSDIEETGIGCRQELDFDGGCFCHWVLFSIKMKPRRLY